MMGQTYIIKIKLLSRQFSHYRMEKIMVEKIDLSV